MQIRLPKLLILVFALFLITSHTEKVKAKSISELTQEEVTQTAETYNGSIYDGVVTHFISQIELTPKGDAEITEYIITYFPYQRHGIYRWIPNYVVLEDNTKLRQPIDIKSVSYFKLPSQSSNLAGKTYGYYSESREGAGYTVLKIGSADTYLEGAYLYTIKYEMKNAIRIFDEYQELYLNVTGDQWELPILSGQAIVSPAETVEDTRCYTGGYGSISTNCTTHLENNKYYFTSTIAPENELYGMTIALKYPPNTFEGPSMIERTLTTIITFLPLILMIGSIWYSLYLWQKYGKDKRIRAIPPIFVVSETLEENNISVLRSLVKMQPKGLDTLAELVKIAEKDLLTIKYEKRKIYLNLDKHQQENLADYLETQPDFVKTAIMALTNNLSASTNIKALSNVYTQMQLADKQASKLFQKSDLIDGTSVSKRNQSIAFAVLSFIVAIVFITVVSDFDSSLAARWAIPSIVAGISFTLSALGMFKRTNHGEQIQVELLGLKKYIETAELERLEFFNDPEKMISHFESILPYAIILGLDKKWTKLFGPILEKLKYAPTWMQSDIPLYNALPRTYASMSRSMNSYVSKISTPPQSSSSSFGGGGFSGGGFSGGGSGGGGGGSW